MRKYLDLLTGKTKRKCVAVILMAFVSSILASVWPVRLGELYTEISIGGIGDISQGVVPIVTFGLIYIAAECTTIARRVFMDYIIATHEAEVREKSIEKMLKKPVKVYCGDKLSGEQTAQLNQGVAGLSQLIKITCNDIFATVLTAVCTLFQVVMNAPAAMAGTMFCYLVFTMVISVFQIRSQYGIREQIISQKNKLDGQVCQSISNIELIRSMNAEEFERERLKPDIKAISATEKKHHKYMAFFDCLKQMCKIAFQMLILFSSIFMNSTGKMEAGEVITVCLLFQQLVKPIDEVYRFMDETASSVVKADVLINVIGTKSDVIYDIKSDLKEDKGSDIILTDVVIENPEKTKKLAHYEHLHIPGQTIVAIKGESGAGKTTLMRCLNRYYPYSSGTVELFGYDLASYSQEELTEKLCYIPQKAFFFAGSIRDNLLYGLKREATDAELTNALRKASLLDVLIEKAKEKNTNLLDYCIGEGGTGLSGGEGQRLSIARAFLRSPKVYIFDESTAALDVVTTEKVMANIKKYATELGASVIYIAHSTNVIENCDVVIELDNKIKGKKENNELKKIA